MSDLYSFHSKYILPYVQRIKICNPAVAECFSNSIINPKTGARNSLGGDKSFILTDGSAVFVQHTANVVCFVIDINGPQGPNTAGYDIFADYTLYINSDTAACGVLTHRHINLTRQQAKSKCTSEPYQCAPMIMKDGWQIKDDYPWIK